MINKKMNKTITKKITKTDIIVRQIIRLAGFDEGVRGIFPDSVFVLNKKI